MTVLEAINRLYEEIKKEKTRRGFNSQYFLNPEATYRVDMSKIKKDHP